MGSVPAWIRDFEDFHLDVEPGGFHQLGVGKTPTDDEKEQD